MTILTNEGQHYIDKLDTSNQSLIKEYARNMQAYGKLLYPDVAAEELEKFVVEMIKEKYKPLAVQTLQSPSKGNIETVTTNNSGIDFLNYMESQKGNIFVPYGASYCKPSVEASMFSDLITERQQARKAVKAEMILEEAKGDDQAALLLFFRQLFIKVSINIFSGVMKSNTNFKSVINYNAITSVSRFGIMTGYAYAERLLEGNFYFIKYDDVANWCVNLIREMPPEKQVKFTFDNFGLPKPTSEEVAQYYHSQILKYVPDYPIDQLAQFFDTMNGTQLRFVYCASNLKNTFFNSEILKVFCDEITGLEGIEPYTGEVKSIHALPDEEIFIYSLVLLSDEFVDSDGKNITHDRIDKEFPELARRIYSVYHHLESKLKVIEPLFTMVAMVDSLPHDVMAHKSMKRETVVLSDTDSILFTTASWVDWMCGGPEISTKAANISAFMILLVCKALIHLFRTIDARMGMQVEHIDTLAMKNEFMYDVFIRVVHAKTYAGYNSYKEGAKLPKRKIDMKGKSFKGSDLCSETTTEVKKFFQDIFDIIGNNEKLTSNWLIRRIVGFEQRIVKSVENGDPTFFKATPIKNKTNYKNPLSSSYFYAMMWEAVFEKKHGAMPVPGKTKVINITPSSPAKLRQNEELDTEFRNALADFLEKYKKKEIINIYIPMGFEIPKELVPLIDISKCVTANCFSFYLLLQSFEISVPERAGKKSRMLSEMYVSIAKEMRNEN